MTLSSSRPARPAGFTLETLPLPQPTRMADAWMLTVHSLKDCPKLDLCAHAPPQPPARPNASHSHDDERPAPSPHSRRCHAPTPAPRGRPSRAACRRQQLPRRHPCALATDLSRVRVRVRACVCVCSTSPSDPVVHLQTFLEERPEVSAALVARGKGGQDKPGTARALLKVAARSTTVATDEPNPNFEEQFEMGWRVICTMLHWSYCHVPGQATPHGTTATHAPLCDACTPRALRVRCSPARALLCTPRGRQCAMRPATGTLCVVARHRPRTPSLSAPTFMTTDLCAALPC